MNKVLICGSRDCTPAMQDYAARLVRATQISDPIFPSLYGASIIVGDVSGVDDAVVRWCFILSADYRCFGISPSPRCEIAEMDRYVDVWKKPYAKGAHLFRDRVMVDTATHVVALWNGVSRGTKYTYDYAVKQGKVAKLVTFKDGTK